MNNVTNHPNGLEGSLIDYKLVVNDLINLKESTTYFLEGVKGMDLKVAVESQSEDPSGDRSTLRRMVKLFFTIPDMPALYCESHLKKGQLTPQEYDMLIQKELPIGRVFKMLNNGHEIKKLNIMVEMVFEKDISALLNVKHASLWRKSYDYWVGERHIGHIIEFFNEESIARV